MTNPETDIADTTSNIASNLGDQVSQVTANAQERAKEAWHTVQGQTQRAMEETTTYVRENPVPTILTALGAGFVLGLLVGRHEQPSFQKKYIEEPFDHSRGVLLGLTVALGSLLKNGLSSASSAAEGLADKVSDIDIPKAVQQGRRKFGW